MTALRFRTSKIDSTAMCPTDSVDEGLAETTQTQVGVEPWLRVEGVSVGFGTSSPPALSEVTLESPPDEFLVVIGRSGSGKTTLLNVVSGLLLPTVGRVELFGRPVAGAMDRLGYMFARDALLPWRTALDNVALPLEMRGVKKAERQARAAEFLERVHLTGSEMKYPGQLSHGMRQRVALARTWVTNPSAILMDEPFAALDAQTRESVRGSFLQMWEDERQSVLFVTHDLEEAILLGDRVVVLAEGKVVRDISVKLERPRKYIDVMSSHGFRESVRTLRDAIYHDYTGFSAHDNMTEE